MWKEEVLRVVSQVGDVEGRGVEGSGKVGDVES
jgi:hypothetical protein